MVESTSSYPAGNGNFGWNADGIICGNRLNPNRNHQGRVHCRTWDGTLHFQGKHYPLRIGGVNFGPLGATGVDLLGRAYHMRIAGSIHGIYSSVDGGSSEANAIRLRNWHGVVL
jgi:hypothetical protein